MAPVMHAPAEYKHIWSWGKMLGSLPGWVVGVQEQASREGAPVDAIFKRDVAGWEVASDLPADHRFLKFHAHLK